MFTALNTGYTGDPNLSVLPALNGAPQGSFFIDNTGPDYDLYYKQIQAVSTSWVLVGTGAGGGGGGGGGGLQVTDIKTANYTAAVGELVLVDLATAGMDVTIDAPPTANTNESFGVKTVSVASGWKLIVDSSPVLIDGSTTLELTTDYAFAAFQYDGTDWFEVPGGGDSGGYKLTTANSTDVTAVSGMISVMDLIAAGTDLIVTAPVPGVGVRFGVVIRGPTGGFDVTVVPDNTETFVTPTSQAAASYVMNTGNATAYFQWDGSSWQLLL